MSASPTDTNTHSNDAQYTPEGRKQSPPAFLDLADSAARLGTNMPDMSARVELKRMEKRMEHERQRMMHRQLFEEQMRALEQQQAAELLTIPVDSADLSAAPGGGLHVALSAPTTPPRAPSVVNGLNTSPTAALDVYNSHDRQMRVAGQLSSVLSKSDKRKSVTYATVLPVLHSPDSGLSINSMTTLGPIGRTPGAKSMPASRRTSASADSLETDDLAGTLQSLALLDTNSQPYSQLSLAVKDSRYVEETGVIGGNRVYSGLHNAPNFNAGRMLDQQLDQEMHNAMRNLPTSDDDKYPKLSASSAALDLAPLSQNFIQRSLHSSVGKSSEWPQFSGSIRGPDAFVAPMRPEQRRNVTTPSGPLVSLGPAFHETPSATKLNSSVTSAASTNHASHHSSDSRRGSPPGVSDAISNLSSIATARSVPATPIGPVPVRPDIPNLVKTPGTPATNSTGSLVTPGYVSGSQFATSTMNDNSNDNIANIVSIEVTLSFGSIQHSVEDTLQYSNGGGTHAHDNLYSVASGLNGGIAESNRYNNYGFDQPNRLASSQTSGNGSTALYHHHGSRYGLNMGRMVVPESKMNGLHGPKHKRGDMDREFNRFSGTRLEELQGEIPQLCKDQHGCRYLQKKLEEGVPEHRDMIFRETFGHFADLMTDPFGNYLCQKLLEYSTDEQRNVICESVASDLVTISLNMHGEYTIFYPSTMRLLAGSGNAHCPITKQADLRYDAQIHAIIIALSLHVVTLIKDLNGNHVIQKCLNKLAPEDNQFIYNAVAANCVEVATHRHGCCVLQRCIDHASDQQRVQLVQEITYNALTLVQDPYGNYVVQYILDLNDNRFSDGVIRQFTGNVCALSVQKFSSNVIEKCIRVAEHSTRKILIDELLNRNRLEKLLRDSYGNYCVQTALDYAEPNQRMALVEGIRPILPLIRNTPYGKRIQSKLQREQLDVVPSGHYGNGYPNQHQSLASLGVGLGSHPHSQIRHVHGQSLHHPQSNQLGDIYNPSTLYSLQNSAGLHAQSMNHGQNQLHTQQLHSALHHSPIEGYVLQNSAVHSGMSSNHATGGFPTNSPFSSLAGVGTFSNNISLGGALTDPYQRTNFPYGM
ncbi:hypothetical protein Clacol_008205 [Clathrus columnatus]|uniref:PUM-HD domain-containing protein n=1 Tax=Clathrus columnatus TaxID=1419009 RepID=A0AAV5AMN1_9AGAM|nr:hypothetical protein Clacol_008205 [Clathrus columnatus]